ncbi:hypothetical protein [Streptomyces albus]|uniref:hypothetical protein n=1 Tax=Streptomyces albus TaxID=1888 RepID=UPI003F1BF777
MEHVVAFVSLWRVVLGQHKEVIGVRFYGLPEVFVCLVVDGLELVEPKLQLQGC